MRYALEPRRKNMLKDMDFCHFLENFEINIAKKSWIMQQQLE